MPANEVRRIVDWLEDAGATYQINGGWAVDALVGRETRPHQDLDLFLDTDVVVDLMTWLAARGYQVTEDWRPVRVELSGAKGRVDVHPMQVLDNGDGIQEGLGDDTFVHAARDRTRGEIEGREVFVASAGRLRQLRRGYEPRAVDLHDLAQLDRL